MTVTFTGDARLWARVLDSRLSRPLGGMRGAQWRIAALSLSWAIVALCTPCSVVLGNVSDPCNNPKNTQEIDACAKQQLDEAEAELNATYKSVIAELERPDGLGRSQSGTKNRLAEAQRYWTLFRDKNCDAVMMKNADGTVRTSLYLACKKQLAQDRTQQLRLWFLPQQ